jgi:hypothetical protein
MTGALRIGQSVVWRGEDYYVEACMLLAGCQFTWHLCDLHPAGGGEGARLAMSDGDVFEVAHGGDWEGMCEPGRDEAADEYFAVDPPGRRSGATLRRYADAIYEANHQNETLAFDRGRLLEYELADGGRSVVFVSNSRWVEFEARIAPPDDLQVVAPAARA